MSKNYKERLNEKINKIARLFSKIQNNCNNHPFDDEIIKKELAKFEIFDNFLWLMDQMPWPLARIYAIYNRNQSKNFDIKKFDLIESFYLELAMINISILLWAMRTDDSFYKIHKNTIKSSLLNAKAIWFWDLINLWRTLSKILRKELNEKKNDKFLMNLFQISNLDFIEWITKKEIYNNIQELSMMRNKIKGHSWNISESYYKNLQKECEKLFYDLIEHLTYFNQIQLISGTNFNESNWIFTWDIVFLNWYIFPYLKNNYSLSKILSKGKIYYIEKWSINPVELSDMIKFDNSNSEDHYISYFYNRVEWEKVRYVTYESQSWDKYFDLSEIKEDIIN